MDQNQSESNTDVDMDQNQPESNDDDDIGDTIEVIPRRPLQDLMEETAYYATGEDPTTYIEAMNSQNSLDWQKAMKLELNTLESQGTWTLVEAPKDRKILKGKWVYRTKPDGTFKARWVVKGFLQIYGLDYNETFANTVKPCAFRAIFARAASLDWEIDQLDIKCTYPNAPIDEEIYVRQPTGFEAKKGLVCKLNKALYSLKQSARQWYQFLTTKLETIGFKPIPADQSIYIKDDIVIRAHIDDIFITAKTKAIIKDIKADLAQTGLEISDLGPIKLFLGIDISRNRAERSITLSQKGYIKKIIDKFAPNAKPAANPCQIGYRLEPNPEKTIPENIHLYQQQIVSLMYVMTQTRADLAFPIGQLVRFMSNPSATH